MSYNVKNYTEQGGEKTVIGGTLEIMEGAGIEGLPLATAETAGTVKQGAAVADCSGTTAADAITTLNALLASLRTAGVIQTAQETQET